MIWPLSETEGALACGKYHDIGMQEILLCCNLKTKISLKQLTYIGPYGHAHSFDCQMYKAA
jgi:hypothetical protein